MNKNWQQVKLFHQTFNQPHQNKPVLLERERVEKRIMWMQEEIGEFADAQTIAAQADAMIDLIYFALGTLVEMGVSPDGLFDIVQAANMAKLWPDGQPHYNEHKKVIKPPDWQTPDKKIEDEIMRQSL